MKELGWTKDSPHLPDEGATEFDLRHGHGVRVGVLMLVRVKLERGMGASGQSKSATR